MCISLSSFSYSSSLLNLAASNLVAAVRRVFDKSDAVINHQVIEKLSSKETRFGFISYDYILVALLQNDLASVSHKLAASTLTI